MEKLSPLEEDIIKTWIRVLITSESNHDIDSMFKEGFEKTMEALANISKNKESAKDFITRLYF